MLFSKNRNRIAMTVVGTLLLVMIIVLTLNYFKYQYQAVVTGERERLTVIADYLDLRLNARLVGLSLLAAHPDVRSLQPERVQSDLLAAAKVLDVVNVALYKYDGSLISDCCSVSGQIKSSFGQPYFKRDFKSVLTGSSHVSERLLNSDVENAYVSLQVPVLEEDQVIAVLAAYVPISDISLAAYREGMSKSQYTMVVDGNGQFIHHPRLNQIFPESPLVKQQMQELFLHKNGVVRMNSALDGVDTLFIYTDLHNARWRVVTAIHIDALYGGVFAQNSGRCGEFPLAGNLFWPFVWCQTSG